MFYSQFIKDLSTIFYAWILTGVFQVIVFPWLVSWGRKHLVDGGWAWGRSIGWLLTGLIIWFLSHFQIPINTNYGIWSVIILLGLLAIKELRKNVKIIFQFLKQKMSLIIVEELLFVFGFFFLSIVRGYHPLIQDLEKFMDAGFMVAYAKSPTLPAPDMWFAGEKMNYYTFGHFMGGSLLNFWGIEIDRGYNLALGFVMGLVLIQGCGIAANLAAAAQNQNQRIRIPILAGLVGALLLGFAGNSHTFWHFFKNISKAAPMEGYWYPDATRFIYHTIHEFPAYSFVVSDLHAHVWSLVFVLLTIPIIWLWLKFLVEENYQQIQLKQRLSLYFAALIGLMLGVLLMTSAWDMAIYGLLLAVIGIVLLVVDRKFFLPLLFSSILVVVAIVVTSSCWWLNFKSISEGIGFVTLRSTLSELSILWGWHFIGSFLAFFFALSQFVMGLKKKVSYNYLFITALAVTSWLLLVLPELVYVKDIYADHPRANTMFKLTFQGFTLMSLTIAWLVSFIQQKEKFDLSLRLVLNGLAIFMLISLLSFSKFSYKSYYDFKGSYQGLDGLAWLGNQYPSDYQAILWLRKNVKGQPAIVEAVGDSYTDYDRVSAFTGLPTIVGWRVHEWLWRGGYDEVGARSEEVRVVFEEPETDLAREILRKYKVKYVFLGDKEREAYQGLDEQTILQMGKVVFTDGLTKVVELP